MNDDLIVEVEARLRAAMLRNDFAALDRLIDDDLIFTGPDGAIASKQNDLAAHLARRLRLTRLDPSDQHIVRLGPVVVVSVRMTLEGTWDGAPASGAYRYTRVWRERDGRWQIIAGHVSAIISPPPSI